MAPDSDKHPQNSPHVTSTPQVINISSESAQFSGDIIHEKKLITSDKPTTIISNEPASINPLKEDKPTLIPQDTTELPWNTAISRPSKLSVEDFGKIEIKKKREKWAEQSSKESRQDTLKDSRITNYLRKLLPQDKLNNYVRFRTS